MWRLPGPQPSAGLFTQTGSRQVRRSQALRPDAREPGEVAGLGRLAVRSVGFGDPLPGPEDWLHVGLRARTHFTASVRGRGGQPGLTQDRRALVSIRASRQSGGRESRQELGPGRQGCQRGAGGRILTPEPGRPSTCPFLALIATRTLCIPSQAGPRPRAPDPA